MKYAKAGDLIVFGGNYRPDGPEWTQSRDGDAWWRVAQQTGPVADDVFVVQLGIPDGAEPRG